MGSCLVLELREKVMRCDLGLTPKKTTREKMLLQSCGELGQIFAWELRKLMMKSPRESHMARP